MKRLGLFCVCCNSIEIDDGRVVKVGDVNDDFVFSILMLYCI